MLEDRFRDEHGHERVTLTCSLCLWELTITVRDAPRGFATRQKLKHERECPAKQKETKTWTWDR